LILWANCRRERNFFHKQKMKLYVSSMLLPACLLACRYCNTQTAINLLSIRELFFDKKAVFAKEANDTQSA